MKPRVLVVVLGELARSPRMQYHCVSLAANNFNVTVIANGANGRNSDKSCNELETNPNINQLLIKNDTEFKTFLPGLIAYIVKTIWISILLIFKLLQAPIPDIILVQNPPSVPTLPILYFYRLLTRSHLVIDWHNYGFTIFQLQHGPKHLLVRLMRFFETSFGRLADAGFCVSEAMKKDLIGNLNIRYPLEVLYDRPPKQFAPLDECLKLDFLNRIQPHITEIKPVIESYDSYALIISSTSWTEDEDFGMLLDALVEYERSFDHGKSLPKLFCVITGKGTLKSYYESRIRELNFKNVKVVLPWLSADDYPKMVASCDLGISLHSSSSGIDLPMKVVDFLGCGIPVLALKYKAIDELVQEDRYGLMFTNSHDLYAKIELLLQNFQRRKNDSRIAEYRQCIVHNFLSSRWEENWNKIAKPLLRGMITSIL